MKKGLKIALFGALAASLVPFVVDVDDSDEKVKRASVKSLLYSVNLTTVASEEEGKKDATSVSISFPGLIGEFCQNIRTRRDEVPEELVEDATTAASKIEVVAADDAEEAPAEE